jgi:hypothetical protein
VLLVTSQISTPRSKVFQFTFHPFFTMGCGGSKEGVPNTPKAVATTVGWRKRAALDKSVILSISKSHTPFASVSRHPLAHLQRRLLLRRVLPMVQRILPVGRASMIFTSLESRYVQVNPGQSVISLVHVHGHKGRHRLVPAVWLRVLIHVAERYFLLGDMLHHVEQQLFSLHV